MDLIFVNGNSIQQSLWNEALGHLLHLPKSKLPLTVEVSFVAPESIGQTSFAETTWTYDSASTATKVRNDAPGFGTLDASLIAEAASMGIAYNAQKHFAETAVHELGHSIFAAIPHSFRVAIAKLFGAESDSEAELAAGAKWQNRIYEGIAETFKEAFLPSRYRVFANRTNRKLSYAAYPTFRRLIREGLEAIEIEEGGEEIERPPFSEAIERESGHAFVAGESNKFLGELITACGVTDALFGGEPTSAEAYPLRHGRSYSGAQILKPMAEQTPYLNHLRKKGLPLNVFLWMEAFTTVQVGQTLTELAYVESGRKNISPLPVGTRANYWFDFSIQIVWYKAGGLLLPGVSQAFKFEGEVELESYPALEVRPPWGNWVFVPPPPFKWLFYNNEASKNPEYSEHPEFEYAIPAEATGIAGFLIGVEIYREVRIGEEGGPPFFENWYADIFRARGGRPMRLDFVIPGYKEGGGSGEKILGEPIEVPSPELEPQGATTTAKPHGRQVSSGTA